MIALLFCLGTTKFLLKRQNTSPCGIHYRVVNTQEPALLMAALWLGWSPSPLHYLLYSADSQTEPRITRHSLHLKITLVGKYNNTVAAFPKMSLCAFSRQRHLTQFALPDFLYSSFPPPPSQWCVRWPRPPSPFNSHGLFYPRCLVSCLMSQSLFNVNLFHKFKSWSYKQLKDFFLPHKDYSNF